MKSSQKWLMMVLCLTLTFAAGACSSGGSTADAECVSPDTDSDNDGICDSVDECVDTDADTLCDDADDCIDVNADGVCDDAATSYTVSIVVTGLDGTVEYVLNGDETKTITEDGTYTFTTTLVNDDTYTVTENRQPTDQSCNLDSDEGTIASANATLTATCADKEWRDPNDNEADDSLNADVDADEFDTGTPVSNQRVAMDRYGNVLIVWQQEDEDNVSRIFLSEYLDEDLSNPDNINNDAISERPSDGLFDASRPDVAMDDDGQAIIVWQQDDVDESGYVRIYMMEMRDGHWQDPVAISPDTSDATFPKVAMDDDNNAIITWIQDNRLYLSEYRNDSWSHDREDADPDDGIDDAFPVDIEDGITGFADIISPSTSAPNSASVVLAMDNDEQAMVVWKQTDGDDNFQIFKSEYRSEEWTHPANLTAFISNDGQSAGDPAVAMDNDNQAIITWAQSDGTHQRIYMTEYRDADGDPATVDSDWSAVAAISPASTDAETPSVAMDDDNQAVIAWIQNDGTDDRVYITEYREDAADVDADDDTDESLWSYDRGDNVDTPDDNEAYPVDINDDISGFADIINPSGSDASNVKVAMDSNGNAVVVWQQSNQVVGEDFTQIYRSEYRNDEWDHLEFEDGSDTDTIPDGLTRDEVCSDNSNAQEPLVAMSNFGDAVVVWLQEQDIDFNEDDTSDDVLGVFLSQYR